MRRLAAGALVAAAVVLGLVACSPSGPSPAPSSSASRTSAGPTPSVEPTPTPTAPPSPSAAAPSPSPTPRPGEPCDPTAGSPDCTDATGMEGGGYRYIEGYADCVATFGADEADGLCFDLDGDGRAGYPDAG